MASDNRAPLPALDPRLRAILDRLDLPAIAEGVQCGFRDTPSFVRFVRGGGADARRLSVICWQVELLVRWMTTGEAPGPRVLAELEAMARARARAGWPLEEGVFIYRRGAQLLWEVLRDRACDPDRAIVVEQREAIWRYLDAYLDLVVDVFARAHDERLVAAETAHDRRARELYARLCDGDRLTVEDRDRANWLRFDLTAPYRPFAASIAAGSVAEHDVLAHDLRVAGALAFTEGARVIGLVDERFDWLRSLTDERVIVAVDESVKRAQLGPTTELLRRLLAVAGGLGRRGAVRVDDFLLPLLLAGSPERADRLAQRLLDGLHGPDCDDPDRELAATARSLVAGGFDRTVTAATLGVHRNTLLYRINKIERRTGLRLRDGDDRALLWLAVSWVQWREPIRAAVENVDGWRPVVTADDHPIASIPPTT